MEYYPRLTSVARSQLKARTVVAHEISVVLWILLPIVILFLSADSLVVSILFSEQFHQSLPYISMAIAGTALRAASWCMAYMILARGDSLAYIFTEISSAAVLFVASIVCFNQWSYAGLGIAYSILGLYPTHRRRVPLSLPPTPATPHLEPDTAHHRHSHCRHRRQSLHSMVDTPAAPPSHPPRHPPPPQPTARSAPQALTPVARRQPSSPTHGAERPTSPESCGEAEAERGGSAHPFFVTAHIFSDENLAVWFFICNFVQFIKLT